MEAVSDTMAPSWGLSGREGAPQGNGEPPAASLGPEAGAGKGPGRSGGLRAPSVEGRACREAPQRTSGCTRLIIPSTKSPGGCGSGDGAGLAGLAVENSQAGSEQSKFCLEEEGEDGAGRGERGAGRGRRGPGRARAPCPGALPPGHRGPLAAGRSQGCGEPAAADLAL